jgi:hypothetical protein
VRKSEPADAPPKTGFFGNESNDESASEGSDSGPETKSSPAKQEIKPDRAAPQSPKSELSGDDCLPPLPSPEPDPPSEKKKRPQKQSHMAGFALLDKVKNHSAKVRHFPICVAFLALPFSWPMCSHDVVVLLLLARSRVNKHVLPCHLAPYGRQWIIMNPWTMPPGKKTTGACMGMTGKQWTWETMPLETAWPRPNRSTVGGT